MKRALNFLIPFIIIGGSFVVGARIIVAGKPDVVLYVPTAAVATEPATRLPLRLWGAGDSSFEWGLGAAMITLDAANPTIVYDSDLERTDRDSYAELGCPLVEDGLLMRHADSQDEGWIGTGNGVHPCDWRKPPTEQDVVIASWGPTSMYDRKDGDRTVNLLDPAYRARVETRMDEFEAFAGVPVLWVSWVDEPSPAAQEAAWLEIVQARACSFDISTLELSYDDGIHLSPQGSLTVGAALIAAAKESSCLG